MTESRLVDSEIINYIKYPNEERYLEFKESVSWRGNIRAKISKSIMAMANLKDGGWIVIGKVEQQDRSFEPVGMTQEDYDSFDSDDIKAFVYARTDPPVTFTVHKTEYDEKKFVLIQVIEFERIPIICKRSYGNIIHSGKVYVRSKGKPESTPVPSNAEMREIVDIAIDKGVKEFIQRMQRVGIMVPTPSAITQDDEEDFARQRRELL